MIIDRIEVTFVIQTAWSSHPNVQTFLSPSITKRSNLFLIRAQHKLLVPRFYINVIAGSLITKHRKFVYVSYSGTRRRTKQWQDIVYSQLHCWKHPCKRGFDWLGFSRENVCILIEIVLLGSHVCRINVRGSFRSNHMNVATVVCKEKHYDVKHGILEY